MSLGLPENLLQRSISAIPQAFAAPAVGAQQAAAADVARLKQAQAQQQLQQMQQGPQPGQIDESMAQRLQIKQRLFQPLLDQAAKTGDQEALNAISDMFNKDSDFQQVFQGPVGFQAVEGQAAMSLSPSQIEALRAPVQRDVDNRFAAGDKEAKTIFINPTTGEQEIILPSALRQAAISGEQARVSAEQRGAVDLGIKAEERKQKKIENLFDDFTRLKAVSTIQDKLIAANDVEALLAQENPVSDQVSKRRMLRLAGDSGNLSVSEVEAFGGSPALRRRIEQALQTMAKGIFTEENRKDMQSMVSTLKAANLDQFEKEKEKFSSARSKAFNIPQEEIIERITVDLGLPGIEREPSQAAPSPTVTPEVPTVVPTRQIIRFNSQGRRIK